MTKRLQKDLEALGKDHEFTMIDPKQKGFKASTHWEIRMQSLAVAKQIREERELERRRKISVANKGKASPKPDTLIYSALGEKHTLPEWARLTGIQYHTLQSRLRSGWSIVEALTTPVQGRQKRAG